MSLTWQIQSKRRHRSILGPLWNLAPNSRGGPCISAHDCRDLPNQRSRPRYPRDSDISSRRADRGKIRDVVGQTIVERPSKSCVHYLSAHEPVSRFSREECAAILDGRCPESFDPRRQLAYDVATALTTTPGPLPEGLWKQLLAVSGACANAVERFT